MQNLKNIFQKYIETFPLEKETAQKYIDFLEKQQEKAFVRQTLEWHFTGSIVVVNKDFSKTLLMHHKKLWIWMNFWWHADWESDLKNVAIRELEEEWGIKIQKENLLNIIDLDLHIIPERKQEPEHYHYDIKFIVAIDDNTNFEKQEKDVNDIKWFSINEIKNMKNITIWVWKMIKKLENNN